MKEVRSVYHALLMNQQPTSHGCGACERGNACCTKEMVCYTSKYFLSAGSVWYTFWLILWLKGGFTLSWSKAWSKVLDVIESTLINIFKCLDRGYSQVLSCYWNHCSISVMPKVTINYVKLLLHDYHAEYSDQLCSPATSYSHVPILKYRANFHCLTKLMSEKDVS
jgi:hypothetical protein